MGPELADLEFQTSSIDLLGGLATTRAIRRYKDEPIPERDLRDILFAATRGPSGSNRQTFRFIVLTDSKIATQVKKLVGEAAQKLWAEKRKNDAYDQGSGAQSNSPKARLARTMQSYVDNLEKVPVLIFPCFVRYRASTLSEGASLYPAVQNLLLAARGLGYGGVITGFNAGIDDELKALLAIPENVFIGATLTLGKPVGNHGPGRRRPMKELVYSDFWENAPDWAIDPPGTQYTKAGPPKKSV